MTANEEVSYYLDVPLDVELELGRRTMTVRKVLDLSEGSIIELSRSAGEHLDLRIGGVLTAYGEIVVTAAATGVRITDFRHD